MYALRNALKVATEDYRNGLITHREYMDKVTLILAETIHTVEVAGWIADMIMEKVDHDEAQET